MRVILITGANKEKKREEVLRKYPKAETFYTEDARKVNEMVSEFKGGVLIVMSRTITPTCFHFKVEFHPTTVGMFDYFKTTTGSDINYLKY
jgi:hypothetical protein